MPTNGAVFSRRPERAVTHLHLDPADLAPAAAERDGRRAARLLDAWRGGRGTESCSSRGKMKCSVLKGDLNLCMKGSRGFAPGSVLAAFPFYFGLALFLFLGPFSLLQAVSLLQLRDVPAAAPGSELGGPGAPQHRAGVLAGRCRAPLPSPRAFALSRLSYRRFAPSKSALLLLFFFI